MKILSCFDGIACARVALERAGIPVEVYYASEVDKYAIQIAQKNYPDIIHIGDIKELNIKNRWKIGGSGQIDLMIGGFPCQDLSIAKKNREGLKGERSSLFYEMVRIHRDVMPKWFVYENVASMPTEAKQVITETLGVEPIMIDAALVSAQRRKRLFWVGKWNGEKYEQVQIPQPEDRGILLKDILEENVDEKFYLNQEQNNKMVKIKGAKTFWSGKKEGSVEYPMSIERKSLIILTSESGLNRSTNCIRVGQFNKGGQGDRIYSPEGKSVGLSALGGGRGAKTGLYRIEKEPHGTALDYYNDTIVPNNKAKVLGTNSQSTTAIAGQLVKDNSIIRKLTPVECERLQSLPDNYTEGVSNTQRYKTLGNAFNVDVVAHILKFIK